ncbi:MAG: hypothetical protein AB7F89_21025, partial [Pirellulaceae bacterium]
MFATHTSQDKPRLHKDARLLLEAAKHRISSCECVEVPDAWDVLVPGQPVGGYLTRLFAKCVAASA